MSLNLTNEELLVLTDRNFLRSKRIISEKLVQSLAALEEEIKREIVTSDFRFPKGCFLRSGKISKGENYKGLPFMILDYPRLFSQRSVFAYRCMFWWGHHFSTTMHIGGEATEGVIPALIDNFAEIKSEDLFLCVNQDPWEYHYGPDNYKPIHNFDFQAYERILTSRPFVKLSMKIPIETPEIACSFAIKNFRKFLSYLSR